MCVPDTVGLSRGVRKLLSDMSDASRIRAPGASTPADMMTCTEWSSPRPSRPPREGQDTVLEGAEQRTWGVESGLCGRRGRGGWGMGGAGGLRGGAGGWSSVLSV